MGSEKKRKVASVAPTVNGVDRLINIKEVSHLTSLCRTSIYRAVNSGSFPKPRKILPGRIAFSLGEVCQWMDQRMIDYACKSKGGEQNG